jgi:hypothetical protein
MFAAKLCCPRTYRSTLFSAQSSKTQGFRGTVYKPICSSFIQPRSLRIMSTTTDPKHALATSGETEPVWIHTEPYSERPTFPILSQDVKTDICIIGSGISGIQSAYELIKRGHEVVMVEARDILSGETSRTSGHLASALDDGYENIASKHGDKGAALAAESHSWAIDRVGEITRELDIDCEYRKLPAYKVSQYDRNKQQKEHDDDVAQLRVEIAKCQEYKMDVEYRKGYAIKGWDGEPDQRDATVFSNQGAFHPTKYL